MKLYIVRHGLTHHNKLGAINGSRIDDHLEPEGIAEAHEARAKIPQDIVKIYSSDLFRTQETAEILNTDFGLEISYHPELREVDFGSLSGRVWTDIEVEYGKELRDSYLHSEYDLTEFGGESVDDVKNRLNKIFTELKLKHDNDSILIVAHGGIIRLMYHVYKNEYIPKSANASMHEFEI